MPAREFALLIIISIKRIVLVFVSRRFAPLIKFGIIRNVGVSARPSNVPGRGSGTRISVDVCVIGSVQQGNSSIIVSVSVRNSRSVLQTTSGTIRSAGVNVCQDLAQQVPSGMIRHAHVIALFRSVHIIKHGIGTLALVSALRSSLVEYIKFGTVKSAFVNDCASLRYLLNYHLLEHLLLLFFLT